MRRDFESGPFRWTETEVALEPLGAGVRMRVAFRFGAAGLLGRLLAPRVGPRSVASVLGYCDQYLARRSAAEPDPVPTRASPADLDREALARGLERLSAAPVQPELVPLLRRRLEEGTDEELLRVRPYAVAERWGADRLQVLRLFLHATRAGLFDLRWELMCPACRVPKDEVGSLTTLPAHFHCDTCGIDYEADFDRRVELRFSVHPAVRSARDDVYCIGAPARSEHVLAQQTLAPGGTREMPLQRAEVLHVRALGEMGSLTLHPRAGTGEGSVGAEIRLVFIGGAWRPAEGGTPWSGATARGGAAAALPFTPGKHVLSLANATPQPVVALLERDEWDPLAATAAQVTALQEFRDLFSSEVLAPGQEVGVRSLAILFSDLQGSTAIYEGVGDAPAYGRVHRHFEFMRARVAANRGAVVKTIGDSVMAAFSSVRDALTAALEMQRDVGRWCREQDIDPPLVLKLGVHEGPVIAVNANGRLDYFGRTVNAAARLGRESVGGDVVLLRDVYEEAPRRVPALAGARA
ncbi:MAG: DUF5939 domain-containing protein [Gemmatimonadota bacterium]